MSYAKMTEAQKANKKCKNLTPKFITFATKGDKVVGRLLGFNPVAGKLGAGDYNQYLLETDDGIVKFSLGKNADKELEPVFVINHIYEITYEGKDKIGGGKQVNKYTVYEIEEDTEILSSEV